MSGKAVEAGKAFLAGVLAKIGDPTTRASVEAAFNDPANNDALVVVGAGALAQSDINKKYADLEASQNALNADYEKLNGWYETRKADFDVVDEMKKAGTWGKKPAEGAPPTRTDIDPAKYISRDEFAEIMNREQRNAANFLGLQHVIAQGHYDKFKEVIDPRELLADQNLGRQKQDGSVYGLLDAYNTKYHDKLAAHAQQLEEARINKLVDDRYAEKMKANPALPVPLRVPAGSPLDALDGTGDQKPVDVAQAAADHYARLQATRDGVPA